MNAIKKLCFAVTIVFVVCALMLSAFNEYFLYAFAAFTIACISFWEYHKALIPGERIEFGRNPIKSYYQKHRTLEEYQSLMRTAHAFLLVLGVVMFVRGLIAQMLSL